MKMTERIKTLRKQTLSAVPAISAERASLLTEFYKSTSSQKLAVPIERALAFRYILLNKKLCLNPGELIAGERGPAPKAVSTYPELCIHSSNDLDILDQREKIPYKVDTADRAILLNDVLPYWRGKSMRDKIFSAVSDEWKEAYSAGVFTEFMEQRAPGHTVADGKIYERGLISFIEEINYHIGKLDNSDQPGDAAKIAQLKGMSIAAGAVIDFAERYSQLLSREALKEPDPDKEKRAQHYG